MVAMCLHRNFDDRIGVKMRLSIMISLFVMLAGCGLQSPFTATDNVKTHEIKQSQATGKHSAKVTREKALPMDEPSLPATIVGGPDGFTMEVLPGMTVDIKSERETETESDIRKDKTSTMIETARNLPWGVYVAVIALIAGGVFVTFKVGASYGAPMVAGGVLVYAVFVSFSAYPAYAAWAVGLSAVGLVGFMAYHFVNHKGISEESDTMADVISKIKRTVDRLDEQTRRTVKAKLKEALGDTHNEERKTFDNVIKKA